MKIGVVTFPGSLDDRDAQRAVRLVGEGVAAAPLFSSDPAALALELAELLDGLLRGLGAGAVVDRHVEAVLGQAQAQRGADAAGAARDQGGPAPGALGLVLLAHLIPLGCS